MEVAAVLADVINQMSERASEQANERLVIFETGTLFRSDSSARLLAGCPVGPLTGWLAD